ncbi:MAG: type II toxin-antitoxin system RelE/ParE family toxin [Sulfuricaulis sp.]|uniref:type II toxin-antitoxin system RelE/ParE family toxin n=1 Tax=Sulfuricaulis sp. TaxID=2003553 RepID=UPI0025D42CEC|nr:type II toxin-antitoxin system RelE/ParE family toxin [Sulfuricaulis sp.]MCR4346772.1 type II toxin-antitoxin system RelE/ParE family toxin [Sulfuricaulis sp.]
MRVIWTPEAQAHLDSIYYYLKRDAPFYANGVVDKLTRRSEQLIRHPRSGRIVPKYDDENLREIIVHPYRLIYRLKPDYIDIIAVFHGAQQLPESL